MLIMVRKRQPRVSDSQYESLGQRLARLRKERALTQVQLAEKLGTIQSHVSAYELGRLRPNSDMVVQLAKALRVSADQLLGLKGNGNGYSPSLKIARRMEKIEKLPLSDQRAVFKVLDAMVEK